MIYTLVKSPAFIPLLAAVALLVNATPVCAQSDQPVIDELRDLTVRARQENAADRWLQRALEALVAKYDRPWKRLIVEDGFADGDYSHDPSWEVLAGAFRVDGSLGLLSRVDTRRAVGRSTGSSNGSRAASGEDLAGALFGAILQGALQPPGGPASGQSSGTSGVNAGPASIRLERAISNAFWVEADFSLHGGGKAVHEFGLNLFQGGREQWGYRLNLVLDSRPTIELERVRRGRAGIVDTGELPQGLADGAAHTLSWTQAPDGLVRVALDGQTLIEIRDKAFRDDYRSFTLVNRSGELAIRRVRIQGTN